MLAPAFAVALSACASHPAPAPLPPVTVSGPVFAETQFALPASPLPPDPATVGARAGSAASHYENRMRAAETSCRIQLSSVGRQLDAAGLIVHLKAGAR